MIRINLILTAALLALSTPAFALGGAVHSDPAFAKVCAKAVPEVEKARGFAVKAVNPTFDDANLVVNFTLADGTHFDNMIPNEASYGNLRKAAATADLWMVVRKPTRAEVKATPYAVAMWDLYGNAPGTRAGACSNLTKGDSLALTAQQLEAFPAETASAE